MSGDQTAAPPGLMPGDPTLYTGVPMSWMGVPCDKPIWSPSPSVASPNLKKSCSQESWEGMNGEEHGCNYKTRTRPKTTKYQTIKKMTCFNQEKKERLI